MNQTAYPQNHKFRPYLTVAEIQEIQAALKENPTSARMGLVRYLEGYLLKISHGQILPQHTNKPTLAQSLGFEPAAPQASKSPGELYIQWVSNPASIKPNELDLVQSHRYTNGLMSPEEIEDYERAQGLSF
jgi:hypothetical protein